MGPDSFDIEQDLPAPEERKGESGERTSRLRDELRAIRRRCADLPVVDERSADEILGYDERGLPH